MSKLGSFSASARIGDVEVTLDGGKLAQQAGGAVTAQLGETILLVTTTASRQPKEHLDFFPLTVDFEEKMYAAGRIPGGFFKREGRPSENAILTCRLVDRPMRPTFADGLRNEIQILITTLSADQVNPPDVLAINGASAATMLARIPFAGPVAGVRMGMGRDGRWKAFPTFTWLEEEAVFDLVVAGRLNKTSGDIDILMVEAEATASAVGKIEMGATKPTEEVLGAALEEAKGYLRQLCQLQNEFVAKAPPTEAREYPIFPEYDPRVYDAVERHAGKDNHDPRLFTWVMLTIFRNLTTQPAALFQGNAFYPAGQSLTFAEPLLTPALLAGPLHALTGNPVLAYNLTLLAFWALSGWAMHAVALRLTGSPRGRVRRRRRLHAGAVPHAALPRVPDADRLRHPARGLHARPVPRDPAPA